MDTTDKIVNAIQWVNKKLMFIYLFITEMRIVIINLEWNNYNGFIFDILNIEAGIKNGCLFGINLDSSFCYIDLFFFNIKLWQRVESKN